MNHSVRITHFSKSGIKSKIERYFVYRSTISANFPERFNSLV